MSDENKNSWITFIVLMVVIFCLGILILCVRDIVLKINYADDCIKAAENLTTINDLLNPIPVYNCLEVKKAVRPEVTCSFNSFAYKCVCNIKFRVDLGK